LYRGWKVAIAGFLINLITGVIYTWSIFASSLYQDYGWAYTQAALPYTVFLFCYPPAMILAGRLQDLFGPRRMIIIGGFILSGATLASSLIITPAGMALLWGLCWGLGLACSFASVTPAAIKWFARSRKGLVAGVVVFGMGISAFIMAPVIDFALKTLGLQLTLQTIAAFLFAGVFVLALFVENPPPAPKEDPPHNNQESDDEGISPTEIFRYPQFYILWLIFCFIAGTGVTFVNHLDTIARVQFSVEQGFLMVSMFSFFNAWGRIVSGVMSDKMGRQKAMLINFSALACMLVAIIFYQAPFMLALAVTVIGLSYGGLFTLFPAIVSGLFGDKHFGFFYGLIFSGMTVGALLPLATGYLFEVSGDFTMAFIMLAGLSFTAVLLSLTVKQPKGS